MPSDFQFIRRCFLLLAAFLLGRSGCCQLVADFSFDKAGGCSPLAVQFTNRTSGASPDAVYNWDFGNGNVSALINPGAIYINEQTYEVTLTVQDGGQTASQTKEIRVYKKPVVDFIPSVTRGCLPLTVNYTASAVPGDGNISAYTWDFGDGSTQQGNSNTQSHIYSVEQTASVSLTVTNNYGCAAILRKPDLIHVIPALTAGFSADKKVLCLTTDPVQFTNTSNGPGILSYLWDFGDGNSSTRENPGYAFNKKGIYSVKLTVTSSEGCTAVSQQTDYLNVASYTTGFTGPETICQNNYAGFVSTSTPVPDNSIWEVGGVQSYSYGAMSYWCGSAGTHTIKLINTYGTCKQSYSKDLTVKAMPVVVSFDASTSPVCNNPVTYHFKDNTPSAVKWEWDFSHYGDPPQIGATSQAPDHDYSSDGNYTVWLRVTNANGCSNSISRSITVITPQVSFSATGADGLNSCEEPITQTFKADANTPLTAYQWTFGDGAISTDQSPTHTFTAAGRYTVSLQYTTVDGCTGTVSKSNYISIWKKNNYDFKASATDVCGNTIIFFDAGPEDPEMTYWSWDFGDNAGYIPTGPHTTHTYASPGIYTVKLYVTGVACSSVVTKEQYITVEDLSTKISGLTNTCNGSRGEVSFTQESTNALSLVWDFGDGTTLSTGPDQLTVKHEYKKSGSYPVKLTASNGQCMQTYQTTAYVLLKQDPVLTAQGTQVCINDQIPIQISGLETNPSPFPYSYPYNLQKLIYPDGASFDGSRNDNWLYDGSQYNGSLYGFQRPEETVRAIVIPSFFNCPDTSNFITVKIKGAGATAGFETTGNNACFSSRVEFRDTSKIVTGAPVQNWLWDFGDGQTLVADKGGVVSHTYQSPGIYYATLKVSDAGGCSSATPNYAHGITVAGPLAAFSPSGASVPLNSSIYFYNNTNDYGSAGTIYTWDFGDQSPVSNAFSPSHTYPIAGTYTVTLTATNPLSSCSSTVKQEIVVKNFNTAFGFTTSYIAGACPPALVSFRNTSVNYTRITWDFGDGVTADNLNDPSHVYEKPGKYIVTLHVYAPNGLYDEYIDSVFIKSPAGSMTASPPEACIGSIVSLTAKAENTSNYIWDFGDGNIGRSATTSTAHQYLLPGSFQTGLILQNEDGCYARAGPGTIVQVRPNPVISLSPDNPLICLGSSIQLHASGGSGFLWTPATGLSGNNIPDPVASPSITGNYSVEVTDDFGCRSNRSLTLEVVQPLHLMLNGDTAVCEGSTVQLNATGEEIYQWIETTEGLSNTGIPNPVARPQTTSVYTVTGSDQQHCFSDTASVHIRVMPLPAVEAGADAEIWSGESVQFNGSVGSDVVQWNWQPGKYLSCSNCLSPVCTPLAETKYILTAKNRDGCVAYDSLFVKIDCAASHVAIPNIFTPNRDGLNDIFMIKGISVIKHLVIFGRWGEKVFERSNFIAGDRASCWDGTFRGMDAPAGSYVYFIEMECPAGGTFTRKGSVALIR